MKAEINAAANESLRPAAQWLLENLGEANVVALTGDLGAGKTALVKALGELLGFAEQVSSPTFSLVNEYKLADGRPVYHFDLYRLKSTAELFDIGFEDYLSVTGALCFIEWPLIAETALSAYHTLWLDISVDSNGKRTFRINRDYAGLTKSR